MYNYIYELQKERMVTIFPQPLYRFLLKVHECHINRSTPETPELNILCDLAKFGKDFLMHIYIKFFQKIMEIEKRMPYQEPMRY